MIWVGWEEYTLLEVAGDGLVAWELCCETSGAEALFLVALIYVTAEAATP